MDYLVNRARTAEAQIGECLFVKPGQAPGTVVQATGSGDQIVGTSMQFYHPRPGQRLDVVLLGPAKLKISGHVNDGDLLTSDANGRGVTVTHHAHAENTAAAYTQNAETSAATPVRVAAMAMESGDDGETINVIVLHTFA